MKVTYRDKEWELPGGMTVRDVIRKVGLQPELVLAVRDGKLLTEDVIVQEHDQIKLVAVISGGSTGDHQGRPYRVAS
jgi:sulfur carrier protein ThiS